MHAPTAMFICTLLHTQPLCTSSCLHSPALAGPLCAPHPPASTPSRARTYFPILVHVCLSAVSCVIFPVECGTSTACQDLSWASAWPSRKGGIPLARGAGRRRGASCVKSGGIKGCAVRQELFWQTGSKPGHPSSHCHIIFTFCGATRDVLCWRLWRQAGATCSHFLLGHVPAQSSLSILASPCCSRHGSHSPSRAILSLGFHE